mmetsp:Transcript_26547/g.35509  ORF Transcript_26547/g.35509 Transcript_26547/m.35509 type:complete len:257 (+) Transcript_26547:27-797(+)
MGADQCCSESHQSNLAVDGPLNDLPASNLNSIDDPFIKFEASLPFNRTLLPMMMHRITEAENECGGKGFVTLAALRNQLNTPAWCELADPVSILSQTLLSQAFKSPNLAEDQIDSKWLRVWSILHCSGSLRDKSNELFCILQDGGFEKHELITAGDKDLDPVWDKICEFATSAVFELTLSAGMVTSAVYTEDEIGSLQNYVEELKENWLEPIYGVTNRLESKVWVEKVAKDANWIFSAAEMRTRLFALADIRPRQC